jgi:hypothetical protein
MPVDAANSIRLFGGWTETGIPVNRPLVNDNVHYHLLLGLANRR